MRILPRRYQWAIEHDRTCTRFFVPSGSGARGPLRQMQACRDSWTRPESMYAADGQRIPFPRDVRESDRYRNAAAAIVDVWIEVDTTGMEDPESAIETDDEGEVDFGSIEGAYTYTVLITLRQPPDYCPIGWADLVPAPTPLSVATTMLTPTEMGRSAHYTREMSNGITANYYVHM